MLCLLALQCSSRYLLSASCAGFMTFECGLYATTVLYRLKAPLPLLKWTMLFGTVLHGVTRIAQAVLATAFFVGEVRGSQQICRSCTRAP